MFVVTFLFMLLVIVASSVTRVCQLAVRRRRSASRFIDDMRYYAASAQERAQSLAGR